MSAVVNQYALALFELAKDEKCIDEITNEFYSLVISMDDDIEQFLISPKISKKVKKEVLSNVIVNEYFQHFVFVLIDNSRIMYLKDIYEEFSNVVRDNENIMDVTIYSKRLLQESEVLKIKVSLEKKHSAKVVIDNIVDETIIGGIKVIYQGNVLNDTVNDYLEQLKTTLMQ